MPSIFPSNGLAPGVNNAGIPLDVEPAAGCEALYYNEQCAQKVDSKASNALISELVSIFNACGTERWDCSRRDNVLRALRCMFSSGGGVAHPNVACWSGIELAYVSDTSVKVKAGECWADDLSQVLSLGTDVDLDLSGTGVGKLDSGGISAGMYNAFYIHNPTTDVTSAIASASMSPTLPLGYTLKRFIGSFKVNASNKVVPFDQKCRFVKYRFPQYDDYYISDATVQGPGLDNNQMSTTRNSTLSVPRGIRVIGNLWVSYRLDASAASQGCLYVFSTDDTPSAVTAAGSASDMATNIQAEPNAAGPNGLPWWVASSGVNYDAGLFRVLTDTSGRVASQVSLDDGYNPKIAIRTQGWEYA